jgi:NTP pyrophosphatase (non-canonical NTP hydrolase)
VHRETLLPAWLSPGVGWLAVPNEFDSLRDRLRHFAAARDWGPAHTPRNLALALVGEVGEVAAELQWVPDHEVVAHLRDHAARDRLAGELADVLIYLVRLADVCGIDPLQAAYAKIERNEDRFPPAWPPAEPAVDRTPE